MFLSPPVDFSSRAFRVAGRSQTKTFFSMKHRIEDLYKSGRNCVSRPWRDVDCGFLCGRTGLGFGLLVTLPVRACYNAGHDEAAVPLRRTGRGGQSAAFGRRLEE